MISRKSFILCTCFCAGLIMSCVKGLQIEIWNNTGRDIVVLSGEKKRIIKVGYHAKITRPNENDDILVETEGRRMMFKFIFPPANYIHETRTRSIYKFQLNSDFALYVIEPESTDIARNLPEQPIRLSGAGRALLL